MDHAGNTTIRPGLSGIPEGRLILGVIALGVTSIVTQVVLFREFLSIFSGNELVVGLVLASWLVLTAIGSLAARSVLRFNPRIIHLNVLLIFQAVLPIVTVFLTRYARNVVFPVGVMLSLGQVLIFSLVLLILYCVLSGATFTLWVHVLTPADRKLPARVYGWEAFGSVIGGVVFNCLLLFYLTAFQLLYVLAVCDLVIAYLLALRYAGNPVRVVAMGLILVICGLSLAGLDGLTREYMFPDQKILSSEDTPYGNVVVTSQGGQKNFYQNNVLLFTTNDVPTNEENVHYAMIQRLHPRNILVLSGDLAGTVREIVKYGVTRIDYVELDPHVLDAEKTFVRAFPRTGLHLAADDARRYIRQPGPSYDVVLINLPEPGTAQLNRYYTVEFFRELRGKLNPGAVVSLSTVSSADYLSGEAREVRSVLFSSLRAVFDTVLIVPGFRDYFLASDRGLDINIARRIEEANIPTIYVNRYYIDDEILRQRSASIREALGTGSTINRDFMPIAYHRQMLLWLSQFGANLWIPAAGFAILVALLVAVRLNPLSVGMFTGGLAASASEVLLVISFQILYGYAYLVIGIIVTVFMAGLAAGSLWEFRRTRSVSMREFVIIQWCVAVCVALLPVVVRIPGNGAAGTAFAQSGLMFLAFAIAFLIGREFFVASRLRQGTPASIASELYGVDLLGSAIGALIVSVYLLPSLGVVRVALCVSGLCVASSIVAAFSGSRHAGQG